MVDSALPPTDLPGQRDWTFDGGVAGWKPLSLPAPREQRAQSQGASVPSCTLFHEEGGLGVSFGEVSRFGDVLIGGVYTELEEGVPDAWGAIVLRVRAADPIRGATVLLELEDDMIPESAISSLMVSSEIAPAFSDGALLTYVFPVRRPEDLDENERATRIGIAFAVPRASGIDIVSVTAIPAAEQLTWATTMSLRDSYGFAGRSARRSLYAHTPARLSFRVMVPEGARFDFGLGVVRDDLPVTFTITVRPDGGAEETLFEESYSDPAEWGQRSLDLAPFGGHVASLSLEATAERDGTVALWSAPTLSGARRSDKPNVILYVIDGAGADFMSVYGYERQTTPNLEKIAAEGALFERAHSNSTWTQPSTASFVTSLHHSVLGGFRPESSPVPPSVTTLAEHLHAGGYLTAAFTSNPNAALSIGPEHGADVIGEVYGRDRPSSAGLHERFRWFGEHYPAEPYWAHFQTTDVHAPYPSVNPFAGRYVSAERRAKLAAWESKIQGGAVWSTSIYAGYREELARAGIDAHEFYDVLRGLYDEAMTQQDEQLGRFVERLKASGEWSRTLLVIASDHGHPAATFPRFGRGLLDPEPPDWEGALFGSLETRIPLIFVWPGHIAAGQRFRQPVSMIDLLPTVLDLVKLPPPSVTQGQSLAPLLLGEDGFETRPVILDEFRWNGKTGELVGNIEMIDGRWGASLEIGPTAEGADPRLGRHAVPAGGRLYSQPYFPNVPRLLLYDLEADPFAMHSVNELHPRRVERYEALLRRQWMAHRALGRQFQAAEKAPWTPEELRALRALGYVR